MITDYAPDFGPGSGYPSGGERIGPDWCDMWIYLRRSGWRTAAQVAHAPGVAQHDLSPKTITGLLARARAAGLLQVRYARCGTPRVRRAVYAISNLWDPAYPPPPCGAPVFPPVP